MCDYPRMKYRFWLGILCSGMLALPATAANWVLQRFEGREYVSLDSIAAFYGFPKPPIVELTGQPLPTPAPAVPAPAVTTVSKTDEPAPIAGVEPPPGVAASKTITLDSGTSQLEVTVGL